MSHIIIVESPAKAKTIEKYLGRNYKVVATMGHVRDLPKHRFGVDIKAGFKPTYEPLPDRKGHLKKLKDAVKSAKNVFLATDPDREGEAIAWHVKEALKIKEPQRIEFNEITKDAVRKAIEHPRKIDMKRVDAQQARRILDRIVGYTLSPLLSRKIRSGLSAGRVQSVAVRLICEREREILAFKPEEYWSITATLSAQNEALPFEAKLFRRASETERIKIINNEQAQQILVDLEGTAWNVLKVEQKEQRRFAPLPFTTSTLQQESSKKLGFSTKKTMSLAQELYEGVELGSEGAMGLITYMRTDSTRIAEEAQQAAKQFITEKFGMNFVYRGEPRKSKAKKNENVQDAHEAIRPTNVTRTPDEVAPYLTPELLKLYLLIWQRFVASQMAPAILDQVTVDIRAKNYIFRATGSTVKFSGFLAVYEEARDEDQKDENGESRLPTLREQQPLDLHKLLPKQHFTEPPPRYTEATLVKALEENGIGRPSTYSPTISTIVDREYVTLEKKRFSPTELGLQVTDQLIQHFAKIIDIAFTALVEEELDKIESGDMNWMKVLEEFYGDFEKDLNKAKVEMKSIKPQAIQTDKDCPKCGNKLVIRTGRYGQFYSCSTFPKCRHTQPLEAESAGAGENARVQPGQTNGHAATEKACPKCSAPMQLRQGRYGQFYGCTRYPDCDGIEKAARLPAVKSDVPCPKCGGELIQRFARKQGRSFFGCSKYPECDFTTSKVPVKTCPKCKAGVLVEDKEPGFLGCSNKECEYQEALTPAQPNPEPASV